MPLDRFCYWIRQIYATQDAEPDCQDVFECIAEYVDLEVAGEDVMRRFPGLQGHLMQCSHCMDLYTGLRDAALLDLQRVALVEGQQAPAQPGAMGIST